jgi:hypothetical protein
MYQKVRLTEQVLYECIANTQKRPCTKRVKPSARARLGAIRVVKVT